jgi:asparagine synthase (glutamine-hydrolysing)
VLGLAAKHHAGPIRAFTLTFDRAEYDEGEIAREMAAHAGAEFFPIPIRQDDLADHFADAIAGSENLCFNAHGVAKYLLSRAVRNAGYKVVLTGEGSDEILGGYPHFRRDVLLHNSVGQDPEVVGRLLRRLNESNPVSRGLLLPDGNAGPLTRVKKLLGFVPSWMEAFSARAWKMRALFSESFLAQFGERQGFQPFLDNTDVRGQLADRDPLHQSLYMWARPHYPAIS